MNLELSLDVLSISKESHEQQDFRCYYCQKSTSYKELRNIDNKLKQMESEDHELLLDLLPESTLPRTAPYVHNSD